MANYESHLAAAREYSSAAKEQEKIDSVMASMNYLRAAKEFNEALETCRDPNIAVTIESRIDYCKTQADRLKPRKDNVLKQGGEDGLRQDFTCEIPKVTYNDVAGMGELKKQLSDKMILPIKYKEIYKEFVTKTNTGIILYGPPGCGKTFIAKATVGELNKRFGGHLGYIQVQLKDIKNPLVGVSEKNLDNVFKQAAEEAPCVLFFDEIDALGASRSGGNTQSYDRHLVNQFLASFERLEDKLVLVVGATNLPWDVDPALMRSGRFGRIVRIDPPDSEARKALFELEFKKRGKRLGHDINLENLVNYTGYMTCSDIVQICDEAGENAIKELDASSDPTRKITYKDFLVAVKKQKSSLYQWCEKAKIQVNKNEIPESFADIIELINQIEEFRAKQGKKAYSE